MSDGLLMKYFVLKPRGNDEYARASRAAMLAYAKEIEATDQQLSRQLEDWVSDAGAEAQREALLAKITARPGKEEDDGQPTKTKGTNHEC